MKTRMLVAAMVLALAMPVAAEYTLIAKGYEVEVRNIRLPLSESGTIAFRECDKCQHMTKRVTQDTKWILNGSRTTLKKFRQAMGQIERNKKWYATVRHHLEADVIVEVTLQTPKQ